MTVTDPRVLSRCGDLDVVVGVGEDSVHMDLIT